MATISNNFGECQQKIVGWSLALLRSAIAFPAIVAERFLSGRARAVVLTLHSRIECRLGRFEQRLSLDLLIANAVTKPVPANRRGNELPAHAEPVLSCDMRERCVLAGILTDSPTALTPFVARLIDGAPETFSDLQNGQIAVAIRQAIEAGEPLSVLAVRARLPAGKHDAFLGTVDAIALPESIREQEAQWLWQQHVDREAQREIHALAQLPVTDDFYAEAARALKRLMDLQTKRNADTDVVVKCRHDFRNPPPPAKVIFRLVGKPVCTNGNLTTIVAPVKTGKTAVVGAMIAAGMKNPNCNGDCDCLGFESNNLDGKAILMFDTEQSPADHHVCVCRILRRAGRIEPPPWFQSFRLAGLSPSEAREVVELAVRQANRTYGGIHSIFLDGVGDLVADVNDAAESFQFVTVLHRLAIEHNCAIICVLHFNPGTEKSRGHLGSQLERKSESNLRLEKDESGTTTVWGVKQRGAEIRKSEGPRFAWSDEAEMHVLVGRGAASKEQPDDRLADLVEQVFADRQAMRYAEVVERIMKVAGVSKRTAERYCTKALRLGLVSRDMLNLLVPSTVNLPSKRDDGDGCR